MSLDGHLTRPPGESRWLTSESSRTHAHQLRAVVDAIIVGAETIRRDNPRLTVRKRPRRTQPWRVILTNRVGFRDAKVFCDSNRERTCLSEQNIARGPARSRPARSHQCLIEGGGDVLSQALDQRLIDKVKFISRRFSPAEASSLWGKGAPSTEVPAIGIAATSESARIFASLVIRKPRVLTRANNRAKLCAIFRLNHREEVEGMKKFMIIALLAIGFIVLATPESNAVVSIGSASDFQSTDTGLLPYGYGYYRTVTILRRALLSDRLSISSVYRPYYWWHGQRDVRFGGAPLPALNAMDHSSSNTVSDPVSRRESPLARA
jgi:hypothetical protein